MTSIGCANRRTRPWGGGRETPRTLRRSRDRDVTWSPFYFTGSKENQPGRTGVILFFLPSSKLTFAADQHRATQTKHCMVRTRWTDGNELCRCCGGSVGAHHPALRLYSRPLLASQPLAVVASRHFKHQAAVFDGGLTRRCTPTPPGGGWKIKVVCSCHRLLAAYTCHLSP